MLLPASLSHCHVEAYHDMRRPHSTAVLCGAVGRGLKTPKPCLSSRVISLKKFILQRLHAIRNHQNKKREMLRQFEVLVTQLNWRTHSVLGELIWIDGKFLWFLEQWKCNQGKPDIVEHRTALYGLTVELWKKRYLLWHPHLLWHFAPTLATYCGWCKCWSTVAARFAATVWDCAFLETRIFQECHGGHFQVFGFNS